MPTTVSFPVLVTSVSRVNQRAFHGDPDLPLLLSLENYDEETSRAVKASIFRERTIHHKQPVQSVGSPKEALLVSLNEKGRVDLEHMAALLARPATEFLPDLKGMVFLNPRNQTMGNRRPISFRQCPRETCRRRFRQCRRCPLPRKCRGVEIGAASGFARH